jgi:hypothetical protein
MVERSLSHVVAESVMPQRQDTAFFVVVGAIAYADFSG